MLKFYNNKILAPLKCGTRQLDILFPTSKDFAEEEIRSNIIIKGAQYIIVRPPFETFKSALHTELMVHLHATNYEITDHRSLFSFCESFINGSTHYSPTLYETIYNFWKRNQRIKIIQLDDLSQFLFEQTNEIIEFDPNKWNFSKQHYEYWISKDAMWEWFTDVYPSLVEIVNTNIDRDSKYYTMLINREVKFI